MLSAALSLLSEREQQYQKLHSRHIALLDQYRAVQRAKAGAPGPRDVRGSREAA